MKDSFGFTLLSSINSFDSISRQCRDALCKATLGRAILLLEIADMVLSTILGVKGDDFKKVKVIQAEVANICATETSIPNRYFEKEFRVIPSEYGRWVHMESVIAHRPEHMSYLEYVAAGGRYPFGYWHLSWSRYSKRPKCTRSP